MNAKILIIDDNEELQEASARLLLKENYQVLKAPDAATGLEIIKEHRPDVVLLDVNLPDRNGIDVCRDIKSDPDLATTILVILISSEMVSSDSQVLGLETGADGYITRPIPNRELLARVNSMVRIKKAEDAVRTTQWQFKAIVESISHIICNISSDDNSIIYVNPAFEKILGFNKNIWLGHKFTDLIHPDDLKLFYEKYSEIISGQVISGLEMRIINYLGDYLISEFIFQPRIEAKKVIEIVIIIFDISERKKLENMLLQRTRELTIYNKQLEQSNKELEQFAHITSHDLKEPLRMISNYITLLDKRYKDKLDADANEFIKTALTGTKRMHKMIGGLLDYSRLNKVDELYTPNDSNKALATAIENLRDTIEETNTKITSENLAETYIDKLQLVQLFQNLIDNSIKFRNENKDPEIKISTTENAHEIIFSVSDNGIGIDPKYFEQIFLIFKSIHNKDKYNNTNTGLGLAICKKIIEYYNGNIWVDSSEGSGATFKFSIPKINTTK